MPIRKRNREKQAYDEDEVGVLQEGEVEEGPMRVDFSKVEELPDAGSSRWFSRKPLPVNQVKWEDGAPNPLPSDVEPKLQNLVCTINVGCELDLDKVAQTANTEYNPRRFSACIKRIKSPMATALIFKTGRMVVTGTKSVASSQLAAKMFVKSLQAGGYPAAKYAEHTVHNIVANCDVHFRVRLDALQNHKGIDDVRYEPECFPGLCMRICIPFKVCFLVFSTGKVTLTGVKDSQNDPRWWQKDGNCARSPNNSTSF